jgi:hypothetical protein
MYLFELEFQRPTGVRVEDLLKKALFPLLKAAKQVAGRAKQDSEMSKVEMWLSLKVKATPAGRWPNWQKPKPIWRVTSPAATPSIRETINPIIVIHTLAGDNQRIVTILPATAGFFLGLLVFQSC